MTDFTINHNPSIPDIESEQQSFTVIGQEDFVDELGRPRLNTEESDKVYAKQITRADHTRKYMIKLDRSGKLYNPLSIYGDQSQASAFLERVCRSQFKYREVNLKAFEMYLKFLSTKNIAWFNNTEREI